MQSMVFVALVPILIGVLACKTTEDPQPKGKEPVADAGDLSQKSRSDAAPSGEGVPKESDLPDCAGVEGLLLRGEINGKKVDFRANLAEVRRAFTNKLQGAETGRAKFTDLSRQKTYFTIEITRDVPTSNDVSHGSPARVTFNWTDHGLSDIGNCAGDGWPSWFVKRVSPNAKVSMDIGDSFTLRNLKKLSDCNGPSVGWLKGCYYKPF